MPTCVDVTGTSRFAQLGSNGPAAIVIDLSRLPSRGRDIAMLLRRRRATRQISLVFVGGDPAKVARIKEPLSDAVYTSWDRVGDALPDAILSPPSDPFVPQSQFAAYAGKPLSEKLGIKENSAVGLVRAPKGFRGTLGELPKGVTLQWQADEAQDLTIWFTRSRDELERGMAQMVPLAEARALQIAKPKRASGEKTDLTQQEVRKVSLAAGLVDYKICSIDKPWSRLLFTRRRSRE